MIGRRFRVIAAMAVLAAAHNVRSESEDWSYEFTPYLFATGLSGDGGMRGLEARVDMSFSDIWESLDSAFMGIFIARNNQWSLYVDGVYAKLEDGASVTRSGSTTISSLSESLNATITQQVYHLASGYRVADGPVMVDVIGGLRYARVSIDFVLSVTAPGPLSTQIGISDAAGWWDPLVGVRLVAPISSSWNALTYIDYGLAHGDSDGSYQALVGLNWQGGELWNAKIGYRYLSLDYHDEGEGFLWDMTMGGMYLGVGLHF